jgi:hypothetical protein
MSSNVEVLPKFSLCLSSWIIIFSKASEQMHDAHTTNCSWRSCDSQHAIYWHMHLAPISNRVISSSILCTGQTQKNGAVSEVDKKFISHPTWSQHRLSAAETVQVSHALPAVCFSCLLWGHRTSFQDGFTAGDGCFLCALFWGVQMCDYRAVWVSCMV